MVTEKRGEISPLPLMERDTEAASSSSDGGTSTSPSLLLPTEKTRGRFTGSLVSLAPLASLNTPLIGTRPADSLTLISLSANPSVPPVSAAPACSVDAPSPLAAETGAISSSRSSSEYVMLSTALSAALSVEASVSELSSKRQPSGRLPEIVSSMLLFSSSSSLLMPVSVRDALSASAGIVRLVVEIL